MLRAISHAHAVENEPFATIVLDSGDRHLRRKLMKTSQGDEVMIDLPGAVLLADGDVLVLEDGRTIEVIAAKEKLYEIRPGEKAPLRHLAWHLGNRHLAAQVDEDRILIRRDHVIRDMLLGLGATVTDVIEQFQPVHGAYHTHDHEHANDHVREHVGRHGHAHTSGRDHRHGVDRLGPAHASGENTGKPDRYGRFPGDPHYGHDHG
ncbi:MAG: urease accessory protein UreE [Rhizobiaceae bacterium]